MSQKKQIRNVLFCILQDSKQPKNNINESLYDAQKLICSNTDPSVAYEKAFVYGADQFMHFRTVENSVIKFIRYSADSTDEYAMANCVLTGMNLLKEKYLLDRKQGFESLMYMVFMTNLEIIAPIQDNCIEGILSFFQDADITPMVIMENEKGCSALIHYTILKGGKYYTMEQFRLLAMEASDFVQLF